ncbi:DUF3459 domain-containing protein [Tropicimonas isoalkanivorans]
MTNAAFTRIEQFRDVETLGHYAEQIARGVSPEEFISGANANGRDNARTPMQWSAGEQAGFTTGTPWIEVNPNHATINVEADRADPDGIFAHYRRLAEMRREIPVVVSGHFRPLAEDHPGIVAYLRELDGTRLAVIGNFTADRTSFEVPADMRGRGQCLISSHAKRETLAAVVSLEPFESFAMRLGKEE